MLSGWPSAILEGSQNNCWEESIMAGLTTAEIEKINEELEGLRRKLRDNGATALNPTVEWSVLRKEVGVLNKKLNADSAAKKLAEKTAS
jgi:superoxide dismutase